MVFARRSWALIGCGAGKDWPIGGAKDVNVVPRDISSLGGIFSSFLRHQNRFAKWHLHLVRGDQLKKVENAGQGRVCSRANPGQSKWRDKGALSMQVCSAGR